MREIVGLEMNAAKAAFAEYLNNTNLDARQIYFVNQFVEYIVHNGLMKDLSVLQSCLFITIRKILIFRWKITKNSETLKMRLSVQPFL